MADTVVYQLGVGAAGQQTMIPIRVRDNGDGSFSPLTVLAGDQPVVPVDPGIVTTIGLSVSLTPTITVSTTPAYTPGDVVGGEISLTGALRAASATGILQSVFIRDNANQKAPLTLLFFNDNPAGTFTDNSPCPDLTADLSKIVRKVNIAAVDYETIGTVALADVSAIAKMVKAGTSGGDLWLVIVTPTGTPTYTATGDLIVTCGFLQDY